MVDTIENDRQQEFMRWIEEASSAMVSHAEARILRSEFLDHYQELRSEFLIDVIPHRGPRSRPRTVGVV